MASRTYLDAPAAGAPPTDDVLVELLQRRASLVAEVEELLVKKAFMAPDEYATRVRAHHVGAGARRPRHQGQKPELRLANVPAVLSLSCCI